MLSAAPSLHSTTNGDADLKKKKTCRSAFLRAVIRLLLSLFRRPSALAEKNKRERKRNAQEHKITRSGNNSGTPFKRLAVTQPLKGKYTHTHKVFQLQRIPSLSLSSLPRTGKEGEKRKRAQHNPTSEEVRKKKKSKRKQNQQQQTVLFFPFFIFLSWCVALQTSKREWTGSLLFVLADALFRGQHVEQLIQISRL